MRRKTPDASRSSPPRGLRPPRAAFTLVEIVIALGIFAFCIIAVLGLLNVALSSSRDAQIDSSTVGMLHNISASVRSLAASNATPPADQYFDMLGNSVSASSDAFYKVTYTAVPPASVEATFALGDGSLLQVFSVAITHPAPVYNRSRSMVIGRPGW